MPTRPRRPGGPERVRKRDPRHLAGDIIGSVALSGPRTCRSHPELPAATHRKQSGFKLYWLPFRILIRQSVSCIACSSNRRADTTASPAPLSALRCAIHVFSNSNFLSEACLKDPEALWEASRPGSLERAFTVDDYTGQLHRALPPASRRRFIWPRSGAGSCCASCCATCWGWPCSPRLRGELSNLADAILDVTYRRIRDEFAALHGEPRLADGRPCGFSVISLGKLGGQELNYSSDIDLMFLYGGPGETDGPSPVTNKEFYKKVANRYTDLLSRLHRRGPMLSRGSASAARWHAGRDLHLRRRRHRVLRTARARLGKADADQGARLGGRARSPAPRCSISSSR